MGTTLTNGIYLPNEGEKNCYAGLKTNWEILDQKIADIAALQQAVAGALHREIVASLPTTDIDPNTIYMILSGTSATENVYDEFMYVNNAWELIGTSATDLTNYYTKGDVDGLLLLKANASDLTSHTGDTTIHVTASDKSKWNTVALIKQLRLVNAQVGSATTIAFSDIDDTNGIKVGDKCMDLDAKMFEITAVDTANQTVTVGSALIDLALDGNVVHKSGNETIGGEKTFNDLQIIGYGTQYKGARNAYILPEFSAGYSGLSITTLGYGQTLKIGNFVLDANNKPTLDTSKGYIQVATGENNSVNACVLEPRNSTSSTLGTSANRWSKIYGTEYYYGSNNVEFSTKFVTTDTDQSVSGNKVWTGTNNFKQNITYERTNFYHQVANPCYILKDPELEKGSLATTHTSYPGLWHDKNGNLLGYVRFVEYSSGRQTAEFKVSNLIKNGALDPTGSEVNCAVDLELQPSGEKSLIPEQNNDINLGTSTNKWKSLNGLNPGALSLPDLNSGIDISGYVTDLTGGTNNYTPTVDGYISLCAISTGSNGAFIKQGDFGASGRDLTISGTRYAYVYLPVVKNVSVDIVVVSGSLGFAKFYPCQGNV